MEELLQPNWFDGPAIPRNLFREEEVGVEFVLAPQHVLWFWNNNERRFRPLEKIIEESDLEVYRRIHDKSNEAED